MSQDDSCTYGPTRSVGISNQVSRINVCHKHSRNRMSTVNMHLISDTPWRSPEDLRVDGFESQALRGRPVHEDVDPEDLHGVQRVGDVGQGGEGDEHQGRYARGELKGTDSIRKQFPFKLFEKPMN